MADKRKTKRRKDRKKEFDEPLEQSKPTSNEYSVAKWLKTNVPTKKTKFLNHNVEYFTGTKAIDALLESSFATGKSPLFTTRHDVRDYLHEMLLHKFFHRAKKVPVSEAELKGKKKREAEKTSKSGDEKDGEKSQASACEGKDTKDVKDKEKKKRKIRLEMHLEQIFLDTMDAYVWIYDPMPWYYWLCGTLVVLGTVAVCMFPLWPSTVRKGVYYLSVLAAGFLVVIIGLAVLRVVVFCAVWLATMSRHHLWLLPNLTEDVGFLQSFWPLYKYEYKGPDAESQKSSKSKKKRKKDKQSDDEADDKKPLIEEKKDETTPQEAADTPVHREDPPTPNNEKGSESESENSQRSSTDRDFEMIESADVEPDHEKSN